jgi:hypothetical protein
MGALNSLHVMAGFIPAIHVLLLPGTGVWMPGTGPGMTNCTDAFASQITTTLVPTLTRP